MRVRKFTVMISFKNAQERLRGLSAELRDMSETGSTSTAALRVTDRAKWVRSVAAFSALCMLLSACTGGGVVSAVDVQKIPVDLKFGAPKPGESVVPPAAPPTTVTRTIKIPDFSNPGFKPPVFIDPPKSCVITDAGPDLAAPREISREDKPSGLGVTLPFTNVASEILADGSVKKHDKPANRKIGSVLDLQSMLPDLDQGPQTGRRFGYQFDQVDGFTGVRSTFVVMPGEDPGDQQPEVGLFLKNIAYPHGLGTSEFDTLPVVTDPTNNSPVAGGGVKFITPLQPIKITTFPIIEGKEQIWTHYAPVAGVFVTSRAKVVKRDNRLRACGEWVAGWRIDWSLTIGQLPDLGVIASNRCDPTTILASVVPLLNPQGGLGAIDNIIVAYRQTLEERAPATKPIWDFYRSLGKIAPAEAPGQEQMIELYEEQLAPPLRRICGLDDAQGAFQAVRDVIGLQYQTGSHWFASQFGGIPVREEVKLRGKYINADVVSNIFDITKLVSG